MPSGRLVYVERNTGWLRFRNLQTGVDHRVHQISSVNFDGERGALGVAMHPNWPTQPFVYVYVTRNTPDGLRNQVLRIKVQNGHSVGVRRLLSVAAGPASNHNGGRILFGPDKKLYVVIGDNADPANSQDRTNNLRGKILRMNPDGSRPADNPFPNLIWAYGIRNSIGFAFDPQNGRLWESENGPSCNDEVNRIVRGANHGLGAERELPEHEQQRTDPEDPSQVQLLRHRRADGPRLLRRLRPGTAVRGGSVRRSRERRQDQAFRPQREPHRFRRRPAARLGSARARDLDRGRAERTHLLQRLRRDLPAGTRIEVAKIGLARRTPGRGTLTTSRGDTPETGDRPPGEDRRGHRPSQAGDRDRAGIAAGPRARAHPGTLSGPAARALPETRPLLSRRPRDHHAMKTAGSVVRGLPTEVQAEPILAWRSWTLTGRRDGEGLLLRPVTAGSRAWRPREVAQATCRLAWSHEAPNADCSCGLHATRELDFLRRTRCPAVLGRVALWGRVIEHEHGYRARYAYPQRLRLICQFCFWQESAAASKPDVVSWYARDLLVPMCVHHLGVAEANGMRPRRILPAGIVDLRLRETYAVDTLAV